MTICRLPMIGAGLVALMGLFSAGFAQDASKNDTRPPCEKGREPPRTVFLDLRELRANFNDPSKQVGLEEIRGILRKLDPQFTEKTITRGLRQRLLVHTTFTANLRTTANMPPLQVEINYHDGLVMMFINLTGPIEPNRIPHSVLVRMLEGQLGLGECFQLRPTRQAPVLAMGRRLDEPCNVAQFVSALEGLARRVEDTRELWSSVK